MRTTSEPGLLKLRQRFLEPNTSNVVSGLQAIEEATNASNVVSGLQAIEEATNANVLTSKV